VPEEFVSEPDILVRAFNQSGHIAHGKPEEIRVFYDADLRVQGSERIWGNFGAGFRNRRQQRGFSGVGITDEADLGHDPKLQQKLALLSCFPWLCEARRLSGCGGKITISQSAPAPFAEDEALSVFRQVGNQLALGG